MFARFDSELPGQPRGCIRLEILDPTDAMLGIVWQMLANQSAISRVEIHLEGPGYMYDAVKTEDGRWMAVVAPTDAQD